MDENNEPIRKEEQPVIQERIVPKKKNSWRRHGKALLRVVVYALLFGVVAAVTLVFFGSFLIKKLGLESAVRQVVGIGSETQPTMPTDAEGPTKIPSATKVPVPTNMVLFAPEATPDAGKNTDGVQNGGANETIGQDETVRNYLNMYSEIADLAGGLKKSLVRITSITEGVDWFEEAYETVGYATGLYVGDNGLDMLFLVNLDSIEGATKFNVTFENGETVPCSIFSYDTNYRLAVLSIRLSAIAEMKKEFLPEKAKFSLEGPEVGTPVMVLGTPNGHLGAMELGMVTGTDQVVQVIDDEVLYFTTGITEYAEGDGFVFDLTGNVIGMVSSSLNKGENGVITAATISGLCEVIEDTLNNVPRVYCGMRLESVDTVMGGKYSLPQGIYVAEVLTGSPAMYAGIKNGDIITMVGIEPITGVRQFYKEISSVGGQSVRVIVSRDAKGERKEQTLFMTPESRMH